MSHGLPIQNCENCSCYQNGPGFRDGMKRPLCRKVMWHIGYFSFQKIIFLKIVFQEKKKQPMCHTAFLFKGCLMPFWKQISFGEWPEFLNDKNCNHFQNCTCFQDGIMWFLNRKATWHSTLAASPWEKQSSKKANGMRCNGKRRRPCGIQPSRVGSCVMGGEGQMWSGEVLQCPTQLLNNCDGESWDCGR